MPSLLFVSSGATLASCPTASSQPVQLNLHTYVAALQRVPARAIGSFNLSTVSFAPYSRTQNYFSAICHSSTHSEASVVSIFRGSSLLFVLRRGLHSPRGPSFLLPCSVPLPPQSWHQCFSLRRLGLLLPHRRCSFRNDVIYKLER